MSTDQTTETGDQLMDKAEKLYAGLNVKRSSGKKPTALRRRYNTPGRITLFLILNFVAGFSACQALHNLGILL